MTNNAFQRISEIIISTITTTPHRVARSTDDIWIRNRFPSVVRDFTRSLFIDPNCDDDRHEPNKRILPTALFWNQSAINIFSVSSSSSRCNRPATWMTGWLSDRPPCRTTITTGRLVILPTGGAAPTCASGVDDGAAAAAAPETSAPRRCAPVRPSCAGQSAREWCWSSSIWRSSWVALMCYYSSLYAQLVRNTRKSFNYVANAELYL